MRCLKCLQEVKALSKRCECGFALDDVPAAELQNWFAEVRQTLELAYIPAATAWQQSGKSGTFEDWVRLRIANIAPVQRSGTYLDIGCANGYLLECLHTWARLKGVEIKLYGLDYSAQLADLARQRLQSLGIDSLDTESGAQSGAQSLGTIYVGNAWDWTPPQSFDYVRAELDYVPRNYRQRFVERLLAQFVAPGGRLLIAQYRSRRDDLTQGWVGQELQEYGFRIVETHSGYSGDGLELCRVLVLQP